MTTRSDRTTPGRPVPLCEPWLAGREEEFLRECVETNWVSSAGPFVDRFEEGVAALLGARHAVATSSGTAALHLALLVAGVEPDDEVLVSTLTFIAPANAVRYVGAHPVLVDADPGTWQMAPDLVVSFLTRGCEGKKGELRNRTTGRRVRALLPVHILGHSVDMDPLVEVARRFGLALIEDATESLGAAYRGRKVGTLGDVACLSFNGNKIITTGGGGMLVTADGKRAERARYLSTQAKDDPVENVHGALGYNYRLTNVQAALGCAQLERFPEILAAKRAIASAYAETAARTPGLELMPRAPWAEPSWWMPTVLVDPEAYGRSSRELLRELDRRQIRTRPLWQPLHEGPVHREAFRLGGDAAMGIQARSLSLPCSAGMDGDDLLRVRTALAELSCPR